MKHTACRFALLAVLLGPGCPEGEQKYDFDGDGVEDQVDCAPEDATIYPGAEDDPTDGIDQDCDGGDGVDRDADGYAANRPPEDPLRDCDDQNAEVYPGADDPPGDGVDQDCDGADGILPPTVGITPASPRTGDDLEALVVTDAESWSLTWLKGGDPQPALDDLDTVPAALTARGEVWTAHAEVVEGGTTLTGEAEVSIINTPPSVAFASGLPFEAREGDVLAPSMLSEDPDGDTVTLTHAWFFETDLIPGETEATLESDVFDRGQKVLVVVTPSDGQESGEPATSNLCTIVNTPPAASSVAIDPSSGFEQTTFTALPAGWSDPDPVDTEAWELEWLVDGSLAGSSPTLDGAAFNRGQGVLVRARPLDGITPGQWVESDLLVVANTLPTITSVSITPGTGTVESVFACTPVGWFDPDPADSEGYTWAWFVDGVAGAQTQTLAGSTLERGDVLTCEATPVDSVAPGAAMLSAPVTVGNALPTMSSVQIGPGPVYEGSTLSVQSTDFADSDGDTPGYQYDWLIDGVSTGATTPVLDGATFSEGEGVVLSLTAWDGLNAGSTVLSNGFVVLNTPPPGPMLTADPPVPAVTEAFACLVDALYADVDGDPVTFTFEWTLEGNTWTGPVASTVLPGDTIEASSTQLCDDWVCTATPDDGEASGPSSSVSVEIGGCLESTCSNSVPYDIPDNHPIGVTDTVTVPYQGITQSISVSVTLTNSDIAWLYVDLEDPNGATYRLHNRTGAGTSLNTSYPVPTPTATGDLTTWIGDDPSGDWSLTVYDGSFNGNGLDGAVTDWCVVFDF